MIKYLIAICFFTCCTFAALAQDTDTTATKSKQDSIALKKKADALAIDTDAVRSFKPKVKKEKVYHPDSLHSPHTAIMRSLMVPGWGQLYNHRWWKVPFIYGGIGLLGVAIVFNQTNYAQFSQLALYFNRGIVVKPTDKYYAEYTLYKNAGISPTAINDAADGYRRNRDLCYLGVAAAWFINVVDAYIDAKFIHSFTVDDKLSFKVNPGLISQPVYAQNYNTSYIPGIKIIFTLR